MRMQEEGIKGRPRQRFVWWAKKSATAWRLGGKKATLLPEDLCPAVTSRWPREKPLSLPL